MQDANVTYHHQANMMLQALSYDVLLNEKIHMMKIKPSVLKRKLGVYTKTGVVRLDPETEQH